MTTELRDVLADLWQKPAHHSALPLREIAGTTDKQPLELSSHTPAALRNLDVLQWLPLAAKELAISANPRDYVVVPVIMMPSDLPNRNSVAMPYEDLLKFNTQQGRPNYKTWVGKATHIDHKHGPLETASRGIIFDAYMRPMRNVRGSIHKLIALCGFDRTKDPELANEILTGRRIHYSMGARIGRYECSVCGCNSRPGMINTECGHVQRGRVRFERTASGQAIPAYYMARDTIEGFELSSVTIPAWSSATNSQFIDMAKV